MKNGIAISVILAASSYACEMNHTHPSALMQNESLNDWNDDPCDLELLVGASAGDIRLIKKGTLK